MGEFSAIAARAGLALRGDAPPLPRPVYADREKWEQIVLNLVSNAIKFTARGEVAVTLRAAEAGPQLTVRDTGLGLTAEEQAQLFQRFTTLRKAGARSHEGSGLGLALCQQLLVLHGGRITVRSAPGGIDLHRRAPPGRRPRRGGAPGPPGGGRGPRGGPLRRGGRELARAGEEFALEALSQGADHSMTKPLSGRQLLAQVGTLIRQARGRAELLREKDALVDAFLHELRPPSPSPRSPGPAEGAHRAGAGRPPELDRARAAMDRITGHAAVLGQVRGVAPGSLALRCERLDLAALLGRIVDEQRVALGRELTLAAPAAPLHVVADPQRLEQVLVNLLINAAKDSPQGLPVSPSLSARPGEAEVGVRDEGPGIAREHVPRLFTRFFQVPDQVRPGGARGLGLSLYICRQIIERHGGRIWVTTAPGEGSRFAFTLPLG